MSKFIGKGATINDKECLTHGRPCVVVGYERDKKKYHVEYDGSWHGWVKLKHLKFDK